MKRIVKKSVLSVIAVLLALSCLFVTVYADESSVPEESKTEDAVLLNDGQMNLDVVFVLDASGSMLNSDPKKVAIDAYRLFVDLLDDTCGIGYVVYTHELIGKHDIVDISDKAALEETKEKMAAVKYDLDGFTDIALGLTEAKNMLVSDKFRNDQRQKVIILLTDGNTALPKGGRSLEDSNEEMDTTLMTLRDFHIPVYTVGLNYNGKMKKEELERIAKDTDGLWYETKTSEDLVGIFSDVFANIYQLNGEEKEIVDGDVHITVADNSVFTVSIIIRSPFTYEELSPILEKPNGYTASLTGTEDINVTSTGSYTMIKMFYPDAGEWVLHLQKATNENCTVTQMDYYSIYVEQKIGDKVPNDDEIALNATINSKGSGVLDDEKLLGTIKVKTVITDSTGKQTSIPMETENPGVYHAVWKPEALGNYTVVTIAETPKFRKTGSTKNVSVVTREEYEEYLKSGGTPGTIRDYNGKSDGGDSYWILYLIIGLLVVAGAVAAVVVFHGKGGKIQEPAPSFQKSPEEEAAIEEEKRRKAMANFKPEKPIVMPKATDPKLVDYEKVEHDALENLIKKGPEDAFNTDASSYQSDASLEALIRKGPDNPFAVGKEEQNYDDEDEDEDDEYGYEDEGQLDDDTYDYDESDFADDSEDDDYDDYDDQSPLGGINIRRD